MAGHESPSKTWCPLPWFNLNSNTDGRIKPCCAIVENTHVQNSVGRDFNFGRDDLSEIWNSDDLQYVRQQMLHGEKPAVCKVCWQMEAQGLRSHRLTSVDEFSKIYKFRNEEPVLEGLPTSLELRLGNKCNLGCLSCWSLSSSYLAAERKNALQSGHCLPGWIQAAWQSEVGEAQDLERNWYDQETFQKNFSKVAKNLKRLYLTGGEPTMIPANRRFLAELLRQGNRDCHIAFTTNATLWPEDFYELLKNFRSVEVQISLDGTGDLQHYIRYPSKWERVRSNIESIMALPSTIQIKIFTVYSLLNYFHIPEILDSCLEMARRRPFLFSPIILQAPDYLSTHLLRAESRATAQEALRLWLIKNPTPPEGVFYLESIYRVVQHLGFGHTEGTPELMELRQKAVDFLRVQNRLRGLLHPYPERLTEGGLAL